MNEDFWDRQAGLPGLRAIADPNDEASHKNAYLDALHKAALAASLPGRIDGRALDFGCGTARIASWLASRATGVHGIEPNSKMLARGHEEVRRQGLRNVDLVPFDGSRFPFADSTFELITSVWALQHVVDDDALEAVLSEMHRTLRPGGCLLAIERTAATPSEPWLPEGIIRRRPVAAYREALERRGFSVLSTKTVWDSRPVLRSPRFERALHGGRIPVRWLPWIARADLRLRQRGRPTEWSDRLLRAAR